MPSGVPEQRRPLTVPTHRERHRTQPGRYVANVEWKAMPFVGPVIDQHETFGLFAYQRITKCPQERWAAHRRERAHLGPRCAHRFVTSRVPSPPPGEPLPRQCSLGVESPTLERGDHLRIGLPGLPGEQQRGPRGQDRSIQSRFREVDPHRAGELRLPATHHVVSARKRRDRLLSRSQPAQRNHHAQRRAVRDRIQERAHQPGPRS